MPDLKQNMHVALLWSSFLSLLGYGVYLKCLCVPVEAYEIPVGVKVPRKRLAVGLGLSKVASVKGRAGPGPFNRSVFHGSNWLLSFS